MKTLLLTIAIGLASSLITLAGPSWGFTLGNGAGFYYGGNNQQRNNGYYSQPVYTTPAPRVYYQPQTYYSAPQYYAVPRYYSAPRTIYMAPYHQHRHNNCW